MTNIKDLQKNEIVEFYNNKTDWTLEEVEAFENKLIEIYDEDSDFFDDIAGFNDGGYGKYSVMSAYISDWGLDGIFNKYYSSHDIVDLTRIDGVSPFVKELDKFCIVDVAGLMNQFKQSIGIK